MFNMPNQFMPDQGFMNMNYNNQLMDLEQQLRKLQREIRRLEHRVSVLERAKQPYISTTQNDNSSDDSGMYMM